ncbi:hypothetical protein DKX38_024411 [Salix brachista]|uniref:Uncharacterized protein n=1 Tax=Salix brachista TaxID=2182728 RepID=A0A5N5JM54_9ROSI|nr:hypothetical protein DKX38_024411 [Salix brachista]
MEMLTVYEGDRRCGEERRKRWRVEEEFVLRRKRDRGKKRVSEDEESSRAEERISEEENLIFCEEERYGSLNKQRDRGRKMMF